MLIVTVCRDDIISKMVSLFYAVEIRIFETVGISKHTASVRSHTELTDSFGSETFQMPNISTLSLPA